MNVISKNIKLFRKIKNLTQEDLATKSDLTRNYLALIETGRREPSISVLNKISNSLNIPVPLLTLNYDSLSNNPVDQLLKKLYEVATKESNKSKKD